MGRVLIQDFDSDILAILSYVLSEEGHGVMAVKSYDEAVLAVQSYKPDVVFLDFFTLGQACMETCTIIKNRYPKIPVIALSCNGELSKRLSQGLFDGCMEKPFQIDDVVDQVSRLIS